MTLRVAMVVPLTHAEGPGPRAAVWVQGCTIRCPGCVNPHLWTGVGGMAMTPGEVLQAVHTEGFIEGVTFLGGEPFEQAAGLGAVAQAVQAEGLSVMTFTGYRYERLLASTDPGVSVLLGATDLLVDGPYLRDQPDEARPWVGSTNQRFICLSPRYRRLVRDLPQPDPGIEIHLLPDGRIRVTGTPHPALLDDLASWLGRRSREVDKVAGRPGVPTQRP